MNNIDLDTIYVKPYGTDQFIIVAESKCRNYEYKCVKRDWRSFDDEAYFMIKDVNIYGVHRLEFNCKEEAIRIARIIKQRYLDQEKETELNTWVTVQHMIDNPPVKI